jgi:glycosyltransferase involved in cell wall biosynthesis
MAKSHAQGHAMSKIPFVSVVMSTYNTPQSYLKQAVASILAQTYRDFEFIIIDDGSNYSVKEFLRQNFSDPRLKISQNSRNRGLIYSLNKGVKTARGEWIARMDADDIARPERLQKELDFAKKHPQYDVIGALAQEFSDQQPSPITMGVAGEKTARNLLHDNNIIVHPSALIRREFLQKVDGYNVKYPRAEDLALWYELFLNGAKFYVLPEVLLDYRLNDQDYQKRKLSQRRGTIRARLDYYPQLGAKPWDYWRVVKDIAAGLAPVWLIKFYRQLRAKTRG